MAAQLVRKLTAPSQAAIRAQMKIGVQEGLNQMEPIDREVLALRHFEQLSNSETRIPTFPGTGSRSSRRHWNGRSTR